MRLKTKLIYSGIVSAAALITSIIIPIVPCRTAPSVPNPVYKWGLCNLNPDTQTIGHIREYFAYTSSITDSYFLVVLIAFAVSMIFFHYTTKKKK